MKILTPGHHYLLENFERKDGPPQPLQFIEKKADESGALVTINDGTTNEEVLAVLIDRLQSLSAKLPSRQTSIAITKLQEALMWLENRTSERKSRRVEGTPKA